MIFQLQEIMFEMNNNEMFKTDYVILSHDNKMLFCMLVMVVCCIKVLHTVCIERLSNLVKYVKRKTFFTHLMLFL